MEFTYNDTPTDRTSIDNLPENLALKLLEKIREKRLSWYTYFKIAQEEKLLGKWDKASSSQQKSVEMLEKEIASLDKIVIKIEKRIDKINAIRLEVNTYQILVDDL